MGELASPSLLTMWLLVALVGLAALFAVFALVSVWSSKRNPTALRLQALTGQEQPKGKLSLKAKMGALIQGWLTKVANAAKPRQSWQMSKLRRELVSAGFRGPMAANIFLSCRVILALALPGIALLIPGIMTRFQGPKLLLILGGAAVLGFMLPTYYLSKRVAKRRATISRELPDVLDLLAISVEAGLGLDAAINRVAREVAVSSPLLASELQVSALELRAGIPRAMALKNLATRCGVDEVSSLVAMLVQADRFGVSVGRSLRIHSDTVRTKRRQQVEEIAAKIPLKLLFPVLFLLFPAILVVIAGPAILKVKEGLFVN